jgi:hypothetical protein
MLLGHIGRWRFLNLQFQDAAPCATCSCSNKHGKLKKNICGYVNNNDDMQQLLNPIIVNELWKLSIIEDIFYVDKLLHFKLNKKLRK